MKGLNAQQTLLATLPIVFVLLGLIGALIFMPKENLDNRGRASEITPTPSIVALPTASPTKVVVPEIACTDLYMPVCGSNNVTYSNSCEANRAGVVASSQGACKPTKPKI